MPESRTHTSGSSPGAGRRFPGLYLGIVSKIDDDRKMVRVKVRVPEVGGQKELAWARVASSMGGDGTGAVLIPQVGALVHVAFEAEDCNRPVVLGVGWDQPGEQSTIPSAARGDGDAVRDARGQDTASGAGGVELEEPADPYDAKYGSNQVLKTKSGHLIEVDDTADAERISITHGPSKSWFEFHPNGTIVMGVKGKLYQLVDEDRDAHVKGDDNVVVDGDGTYKTTGKFRQTVSGYTLKSMKKVEIEAISDLKMQAPNMELKATGQTKIGPGAAQGAVVTTLTHPVDLITGIPIQGVNQVVVG